MKSCLSLLFVLLVFTTVISTAGLLFYVSSGAEFTRTDQVAPAPAPTAPAPAPTALPPQQ